MDKKEYKQPSIKVIKLNSNDIICDSPGDPTTLPIIDDYVDDYSGSDPKPTGWGEQW